MNAISAPLLMVENLVVEFDGFRALGGVDFSVLPGSLRILIGPNGAGKSTLCDAIIGRVRATEGRIIFKNENITNLAEFEIVRRGICRKFQAPGIIPNLTVAENLHIAARIDRTCRRSFSHRLPAAEVARVTEILDLIGLTTRAEVLAGSLAHGEMQWLEIGMVVATDADLLLLDEPTAGMGPQDSARTAKLIKSLLGRHAVVVIDHDMSFVEALNGPVTVLHQGKTLREGSVAEIRSDPEVEAVYLGKAKNVAHA
ncbi:MAG TPA: urea ABC transporter ATP-binding protein UrtD [Candidatus Baltobacteraceae bacterium]|jgi:urea transport system ATP-binding protein|nr:urea ABC transporter ATP-binding protein UrtD [Candidatus Baltobacteraceae bacterium]